MRKVLLNGLLLLFLLMLSAFAAAETPASVFTLVQNTEAGDTVVGTAVSVDHTGATLVTAASAAREGLYAVRDGLRVAVTGCRTCGDAVSILTLAEPCGDAAADLSRSSAVTWCGVQADGTLAESEAADCLTARVSGQEGFSVRLAAGILPGAVLFDAEGNVAGLAVSGANEGFERWNAVGGAALYAMLVDGTYTLRADTEASGTPAPSSAPSNESVNGTGEITVTETGPGLVTVSMQGIEEEWGLYMADLVNDYYVSLTAGEIALVPDHTYLFWAMPEGVELDDLDITEFPFTFYKQPDTGMCSRNGFHDTGAYLTAADAGESFADTEIIPETPLLFSDLLAGQRVWLQVNSVYQVTEEEICVMCAQLTAPDGQCYIMNGGFLFSPEYMDADSWHWDVTELFDSARECGNLAEGTYTFSYYIAGGLASSFAVEVKNDIQASPSAEEVIRTENGTAVIDLSGLGAAAGEKWRVFYGDMANDYYLWTDTEETKVTLALQAGRTYAFTAAKWTDENSAPAAGDAQYIGEMSMPAEEPFTAYGFADLGSHVTLVDQAALASVTDETLLPENGSSFTAQALREGGRLYLQVMSSYHVEEETSCVSLLTLFMPDGNTTSAESGYTFSPVYEAADCWHCDVTGLLTDLTDWLYGGSIPCGTYRVCYTIEGKTAADVSFTVTDGNGGGTQTEQKTSGGLMITTDRGTTTVDWSGLATGNAETYSSWHVAFADLAAKFGYGTDTQGTSAEIYLVPGESYIVTLSGVTDSGETKPVTSARYQAPSAGEFTEHGFGNEQLYLAATGAQTEAGEHELLPKTETVSDDAVKDGARVYLQCVSHYEVMEEMREPMTVCVTAPDGRVYTALARFVFEPGTETDTWNWELTELFSYAEQHGALQAGTWKLSLYIAGGLAGTMTFDVVK